VRRDDEGNARAALEAYYGLDRPLTQQYVAYLKGAVTGDLGRSIRLNRPVGELIGWHLPWTLLLTGTALGLASLIGILGGTEAAWKCGSFTDRFLTAASMIASNAPVYFVGMMLLILFGAELRWLPLAGWRTPFARYEHAVAAVADEA
jgi:peptide/nickel transport system permease protein